MDDFFAQAQAVAFSTLRVATPLIFAAMGGVLSERAGVVNIALEGLMLMGALFAAVAAAATGSPLLGCLAGVLASVLTALIYGLCVLPLKADQIVAGTAINFLAAGVTPFVTKILYGVSGASPQLAMSARFEFAPLWMAWILVALVWLLLEKTPFGLWVRFSGEHPQSLEAAGIRVRGVRWVAVAASGACAGLGGVSLSIYLSSSFSRNMTAGRGFMALAALIFGKWRPVPAALACLLFGFADAIQIRLQGMTFGERWTLPVQFIQILPYILTVFVLAGFVGRSRAPKALGGKI